MKTARNTTRKTTEQMSRKVKKLSRATANKLLIRLVYSLDGIAHDELTDFERNIYTRLKSLGILTVDDDGEVVYA